MRYFEKTLSKFHKDLNTLRERAAKYGSNAPLELLNQIVDHQKAIALTENALAKQISKRKLKEELATLNVEPPWEPPSILQVGRWVASFIAVGIFGNFLLGTIPVFVRDYVLPKLAPPSQVEIILDVSRRMDAKFAEPDKTKL